MVTVNNKIGVGGSATFEFVGLSGDTKPTGKWGGTGTKKGETTEIVGAQEIANNSLFLELDTGHIYYYMDGEWSEMGNSSSGGGGNLPDPTSGNNGKILGVVDNAYALIDNTAPYLVHITAASDGQGGQTVSTTETAGEIAAAVAAGRPLNAVMCTTSGNNEYRVYLLVESYDLENGYYQIVVSAYNKDAATKRDYMTFESSSANNVLVMVTG